MATSSFGGINFRVMGEQGFFPLPKRADDRALHYRATIKLANATDYAAMKATVAFVTIKPILGAIGASVSADSASSAATLSIPVAAGSLGTYTAFLIDFAPRASGHLATDFRAECEWVCNG